MTRNFCDTCGREIKRAVMPDEGHEVIITKIREWDKIFCCGNCFLEYMRKIVARNYFDSISVERFRFQMSSEEDALLRAMKGDIL